MKVFETAPAGYNQVRLKYGPYSASKLQVASCPARFESKYVRNAIIVEDTLAAARGSAIHHVFERITSMKVTGGSPTREDINRWLTEALSIYPAAYQQLDLVNSAINAYLGNFSPYANSNTKCEIPIAIKLYEEESFFDNVVPDRGYVFADYYDTSAFLRAKLDHISVDDILKQVTVVDHKTTPSASQSADMLFQMSVYAFLAHLKYPGYKVRTVIHFAHPDLNFYSAPREWSYEDLLEAEDSILIRARAVESFTEFSAIPGNYCDYCHISTDCQILRRLSEQNSSHQYTTEINTVDDMKKAAENLRVLGVAYDTVSKALKKAIETNCPQSGIAINGMYYGFRASEGVNWDATEKQIHDAYVKATGKNDNDRSPTEKILVETGGTLKGILSRFDLNPEGFRSWSKDKLKALWKLDREGLIPLLKEFVVIEKVTRFQGYKH